MTGVEASQVLANIFRSVRFGAFFFQARNWDDTFGNPHRAQIPQSEFFGLFILTRLDKQLSIEQLEPTVSQSTVSPPPLTGVADGARGRARRGRQVGELGLRRLLNLRGGLPGKRARVLARAHGRARGRPASPPRPCRFFQKAPNVPLPQTCNFAVPLL